MYLLYGSIIVAGLIIASIIWFWTRDSDYIVTWWNHHIKGECDYQDSSSLNGIPSYRNAWDCSNKTISQLHRLINVHHGHILDEINALFPKSSILYDKGDPIWVRFAGEWTGLTNQLPTLKQIVSLFPDIPNLQVAIFYPGTTVIEKRDLSRILYKYHYGLQVPKGDVGFKLIDFDVKWEEGEGFVWDGTLPHSIWNHTSEPRIILFADVFREFSMINQLGSKLIYSALQRDSQISQKKAELKEEGIMIK